MEGQNKMNFINYAHRGASAYAPQNTMMAFYLGMYMGANGIETDVRVTKDGVPVLFHDETMDKIIGVDGKISDYTFEELQKFSITANSRTDKIVAFSDFLSHFAFRDITFAIELKQKGIYETVAELIRKYNIVEKTVITSFDYEEVCFMREYAPELKCGFLTVEVTDEILTDMKNRGIGEICPSAASVTPEKVKEWHNMGFNVRAWGCWDEELMKKAYDAGVDGMTVNFPDKLIEYIDSKTK